MLREVVVCFIVLFAAIQCQGLDSIPGIDFLSASFDAVKGVPQLPIYRMNYNKNQTWTNISTKTKYLVPDELIATTTGRSLDYSVGTIIKTDEDYRRVQASSFSFSLKSLPFAFSVSADYSSEHKLVQQYLNKGSFVSTSANKWWSFYQLQQLPFNRSNIDERFHSFIASLPATINSDADLNQYQRFIDFYGTHYATSCSFGGQVNVDQFMDLTYYSGLSDDFRKSQLSIKFNIRIYDINIGLSGGISKEQLEKEQDETFNQRSETHIFYRGGDPTLMSDGTQKQWLDSIAKYPTYLNCTMADLWRAIPTEFSAVAANVRQLTEKYLATGSISGSVISKKSVKDVNPPTGSDKVFNGIDAITNEMKLPIFVPSYSGKTMKPSFDPTQTWDLPDNILVSEQAEVTSIQGSFVFNDVESYQGWVKERSTSSVLFGLFKKSKESLKVITNYFEKSQSRIISLDYRSLYKIEFAPIATLMPPLHSALKSAIEALPDSYDSSAYRSIFDTWGTHFYSMAILGGSAQYDAFFTKCLLDSYSSSYVKQQAGINIGILTSSKSSMSQTGQADQVFSENSEQSMKFSGGDPVFQNANSWDKWLGSIKSNPDIIYYKLRPLHEVVTWSDTKSANLARALQEYSDEAVAFDRDAKTEAFKKATQVTSGIEVRDPSTKVFIGPVTSVAAGQSFQSANYHAQLTCERNELGQLRPTLFTSQGGNKALGEGAWVNEDCSSVTSPDFTVDGHTVSVSGVCCFFPAAPVQSAAGIKIENCKLN